MIDILEYNIPEQVLTELLRDHTTGSNILWGTDSYGYPANSSILLDQVISGTVIKPRVLKSQESQKSRTKDKAEVFTPLPIIKKMNDQVDQDFTGTDEDYIGRKVLEVTCGEAPYLVTRYDVSNGIELSPSQREGLLDRKMKIINNGELDKKCWITHTTIALKSTYGYEWQGDSLLLARENILFDINDWYRVKFKEELPIDTLKEFAEIISKNIIQMDGVSLCIPYSETPAKVMNWEKNQMERFDGKPEELSLW